MNLVFLLLILIGIALVVYYFTIVSRNKKQQKTQRGLRKGQPVISIDGSVRGKIEEITNSVIIISVENSGKTEIEKNDNAFKIGEDGTIIRV